MAKLNDKQRNMLQAIVRNPDARVLGAAANTLYWLQRQGLVEMAVDEATGRHSWRATTEGSAAAGAAL